MLRVCAKAAWGQGYCGKHSWLSCLPLPKSRPRPQYPDMKRGHPSGVLVLSLAPQPLGVCRALRSLPLPSALPARMRPNQRAIKVL